MELTREKLGQMRLDAQRKIWEQEAKQQRPTRAFNILRGVVQPAPKAIYTANAWGWIFPIGMPT